MTTLTVFLVALGTALATGLGAVPFLFSRTPERRLIGLASALASGFMIGAAVGLWLEGSDVDPSRTLAGVLVGAACIALARMTLDHPEIRLGSLSRADGVRALLVVGVMTAHSFAEGVGVGVAFGGGERLGLLIAVAIAVHNIPEGLAISLVLVPAGARVRTAALWSIFSSLPQPLLAVPAYLFVESFTDFLPVGLGFAAGAMLWLVASDLLPDALRTTRLATVAVVVAASAGSMLAFQLLLL